jgi:ribosome-binding protein aMBF1 (putative translation factor)
VARSRISGSKRNKAYASAFGQALDAQLARKSVRKSALAAALNVTPQYINRVVTGQTMVSSSNAAKFATALGLRGDDANVLLGASASDSGYTTNSLSTVTVCPHCGKRSDEPVKR